MEKDIAQLREQEAKKERERIAKIKIAAEPQPAQSSKPLLTGPESPAPPSLMPHEEKRTPIFPKTRTRFQKVLIRVILIGVFLFILLNGFAFSYWYLTRKKAVEIIPMPESIPSAETEVIETEEPAAQSAPTPVIFFEPLQNKIIDLAGTDSLPLLLSEALKEEYSQGFTRLLIKNTENATSLTAREFLEKASLAMPESLLSLLEEDFMLFVYSSLSRKRLGLIGELSQTEGVQDMLRSWETTLEQDTKALWEIVGQKGSAYTPLFRQTAHQNSLVRFQTFSVIDFGIVYTLFGSKLILTTSFESLTKAVDQIIQSRQ